MSGTAMHKFQAQTFTRPTWCGECKDYIWGLKKDGVKCAVCSVTMHVLCAHKAIAPCGKSVATCSRSWEVDFIPSRLGSISSFSPTLSSSSSTPPTMTPFIGSARSSMNVPRTIDSDLKASSGWRRASVVVSPFFDPSPKSDNSRASSPSKLPHPPSSPKPKFATIRSPSSPLLTHSFSASIIDSPSQSSSITLGKARPGSLSFSSSISSPSLTSPSTPSSPGYGVPPEKVCISPPSKPLTEEERAKVSRIQPHQLFQIELKTDKQLYSPDEVVTGQLTLRLPFVDLETVAVGILFQGSERVLKESEGFSNYEMKRIVQLRHILWKPGRIATIPRGTYCWNYSFRLPPRLSPTTSYDDDAAALFYQLRAYVQPPSGRSAVAPPFVPSKGSTEIKVVSKPAIVRIQGATQEAWASLKAVSKPAKVSFVSRQDKKPIEVCIERSDLVEGEQVRATVTAKHVARKKSTLRAELVLEVAINGRPAKELQPVRTPLAVGREKVSADESSIEYSIQLPDSPRLPPTTSGSLFSISYQMRLFWDPPGIEDVDMLVPVRLWSLHVPDESSNEDGNNNIPSWFGFKGEDDSDQTYEISDSVTDVFAD